MSSSLISVGSYVADLSKSALFRMDENGVVRFHAPKDQVTLVLDRELPEGYVYCHNRPDQYERYEEYYLFGSTESYWLEDDEGCNCKCDACVHCTNRDEDLLPQLHFSIVVKDDLYQRMLTEVSDAQTSPCGLFFCGHHEDIAQPSIWIAVGVVLLVFGGMAYVAATSY